VFDQSRAVAVGRACDCCGVRNQLAQLAVEANSVRADIVLSIDDKFETATVRASLRQMPAMPEVIVR